MRRAFWPGWVVLIVTATATGNASARAEEFRFGDRTLLAPAGWVIERVAGPPLVDRPITAALDENGRLYVADSSGSNDPVQKQLAEKPHRILRVEDTNGDGTFDRRVVYADRMMFPEGTLWHDGSLYVCAPPEIWKLTDTDDDGVADRREVWFDARTLTGCANDLHGPYLGPDGWVYWCKGAFAEQTYERPGKGPFVTRASHIFRRRADGTGPVEPVMTGGMDNPVDVAFTPGGEPIFSCTFLVHPGGGQRDGLIHAAYGGIWGKVHDPIFDPAHKWTGPEVMPVLAHLGPAAMSGLERAESNAMGLKDHLLACCFNLRKVVQLELKEKGATFEAMPEDFVTSPDVDFHPTDVLEDADGSVLVIDTGGWYKLCCPTSQLHKPDVLGAIYRVRRADAPKVDDPHGMNMKWIDADLDDLVNRLDDARPFVRRGAIRALAARRVDGLAGLGRVVERDERPEAVRNAIWAACRVEGPAAREVARAGLKSRDETVVQVACHAAGLWRDRASMPGLLDVLAQSSSAQNRRAAAEALGRMGDAAAVPALLKASDAAPAADRFLTHSLTYALIEIGDPKAIADAVKLGDASKTSEAGSRRAALVALDQIGGTPGLTPDLIAPLLSDPDADLKVTAAWIVGRHPEWGPSLAGSLARRLDDAGLAEVDREALEVQLARLAGSPDIAGLLADRAGSSPEASVRASALRAMGRTGLAELPASWVASLAAAAASDDLSVASLAVAAARSHAWPKKETERLRDALGKLADRPEASDLTRLQALAAIPGAPPVETEGRFAFLLDHLGTEVPVVERSAAADVLARANLDRKQMLMLADRMGGLGPMEAGRLLTAFEARPDVDAGLRLVAALKDAPVLSGLRVDALKAVLAKQDQAVQEAGKTLLAALDVDEPARKARLESLLKNISTGDVRRGQSVFQSSKAACTACHAIGYLGGKVGPDLTRIGQVRAERDLLEAIVYPSASFVRSYEPIVVALADGRVLSGVQLADSPTELVLATGANEQVRIPRAEIDEVQPGTVSVMPAGLDQQLTPQDLADLVAFLRACR
jgi:putative membrane-bound dehydrogenase-like protein